MFFPEVRKKWLAVAESLKPQLHARRVEPVRVVEARRSERAFQGWEAEALPDERGRVDAVTARLWGRGESFVLDFGEYLVGRLEFDLAAVGAVDAPTRLALVFGETAAEIAEPFDPYHGVLGRGWLQDETLTLEMLPRRIRVERRCAFRYVKITVVDTSPAFSVRFSGIACEAVSSADWSRVAALPTGTAGGGGLPPDILRMDEVSLRTLACCMQTVFEDGPKRDRRLWVGDLRLQALVNYASFRNHDLVKRCLYLFAALAGEDGIVTACVFEEPAPQTGHVSILDYSALFVNTLLEYAEASGDWETVSDLWPVAKRQIEIVRGHVNDDGLFTDPGTWWIFIDWQDGLQKQTAMHGVAICSFAAGAALAARLGFHGEAEQLSRQAERMRRAAREHLLCPRRGLFVSEPPAAAKGQISWASQAWMVLAGVVRGEEATQLMRTLAADAEAVRPAGPYLYHYVAEALLQAGLDEEAVGLLRDYWGGMVARGADTFWEVYDPERPMLSPYKNHIMNSYCHAWSCTPAWFIRRAPEIFGGRPVATAV